MSEQQHALRTVEVDHKSILDRINASMRSTLPAAAEYVKNNVTSMIKDYESALASFFGGGEPKNHAVERVGFGNDQIIGLSGEITGTFMIDGQKYNSLMLADDYGNTDHVVFPSHGESFDVGDMVNVSINQRGAFEIEQQHGYGR